MPIEASNLIPGGEVQNRMVLSVPATSFLSSRLQVIPDPVTAFLPSGVNATVLMKLS